MLHNLLLYQLRTTRHNLRSQGVTLLLSLAAVSVSLLLFASYLLLLANLQSVARRAGQELQVVAYLEEGGSEADRKTLTAWLEGLEKVESVTYCPPDRALESLKAAMGDGARVLEGLSENPLPGSLEIRLAKPYRNLDAIRELAARVKSREGVSDVEYGGSWIERFFAVLRVLRWLALSLGVLLLFATVIVISSTLTLGFYARREEIEILRLVGATELYVRIPFFLEAMIQGVGGALISVGLLWGLYQGFRIHMLGSWSLFAGWIQPRFLSPGAILFLVLLGALIGVVSSLVSFSRFSSS